MHHVFPTIKNLSDVIKHMDRGFIFSDKGDYKVINYREYDNLMFPVAIDLKSVMQREMRGITFDKEGKIIARPYHKFFDVGERIETKDINLHKIYKIYKQFDGTMVYPIYLPNGTRLSTRSGINDISNKAEVFTSYNTEYIKFISYCRAQEMTPIFEWCSNTNKNIIDYPYDKLILTGLRGLYSGDYYELRSVGDWAKKIEVAETGLDNRWTNDLTIMKNWIKNIKSEKGYVIRFQSGHMASIKTDMFKELDSVKKSMQYEKDVIRLTIEGKIDAMIPFIPNLPKQKNIENFANEMAHKFNDVARRLTSTYYSIKRMVSSKKEFAEELRVGVNSRYHAYMFYIWDYDDANPLLPEDKLCLEMKKFMSERLHKYCNSASVLENNRWVIGGAKLPQAA